MRSLLEERTAREKDDVQEDVTDEDIEGAGATLYTAAQDTVIALQLLTCDPL